MSFYTLPVVLTTANGTQTFQTADHVRQFLSSAIELLRSQNYARSIWKEMNVFSLSPTTSFVSAVLERYDSQGKMIESSGAHYHLFLKDGRWQIAIGGANPVEWVIR